MPSSKNKPFSIFLAVLFLLLFLERPAHAYLDAGTGSLIIQLLLAGLSGVAVFLKMIWTRLRDFFKNL
jgi:hypothetical protein